MLEAQRRRQRDSATKPRVSLRRRMPNGGPLSARAQSVSMRTWSASGDAPALLIQIDGEPVYRHVEGTTLDRVVNSQAVIVRDPAGIHYLKVLDGWMEAYGLRGQWSIAGVSPLAFNVDAQSDAGSAAAGVESSKSFDDPGRMLQADPP